MKERPILFSGEMVKAILDGRKTQTRRIAPVLLPGDKKYIWSSEDEADWAARRAKQCPYGKAGDRLWVRESMKLDDEGIWRYSADGEIVGCDRADESAMIVWAHHKETDICSSIHMPRWASRITLEIVSVRVERLQDITAADVDAEGILLNHYYCDESGGAFGHRCEPIERFNELWDKINGKKTPWESNPWVWVVKFRRVEL